MYCPTCSREFPETAKFCPSCGSKLQSGSAPVSVQNEQVQQNAQIDPLTAPFSTSQFFWLELLLCIPVVGFILAIVWSFSNGENVNKRNYCRSRLIWTLVGIVLTILVVIIIVAVVGTTAFAVLID